MIKVPNTLRDRLGSKPGFGGQQGSIDNHEYQQLKHRLHQALLDRVDLEVWWMTGQQRRFFRLEGYRRRQMTNDDVVAGGPR